MKKNQKWTKIILSVLTVICLSACGSGEKEVEPATPQQGVTLETTQKVLQETQNYTGHLQVVSNLENDNTNIEANMEMNKDPLCMKIEETMTYGEQTTKNVTYLKGTESGADIYRNYGDQWTEMSFGQDAAMASVKIYNIQENMQLVLEYGTEWTEDEKSDKEEIVFHGKLSAKDAFAVVEGGRLLQLAGMSGMAEKYYANVNDIPVTFTIDSQTGRPIACTMDLANTLQVVTNNVLQELNNEGTKITVEKYDVIMELSKWNETPTIEIPKEAQTAINYEQEITDMQKDAAA